MRPPLALPPRDETRAGFGEFEAPCLGILRCSFLGSWHRNRRTTSPGLARLAYVPVRIDVHRIRLWAHWDASFRSWRDKKECLQLKGTAATSLEASDPIQPCT